MCGHQAALITPSVPLGTMQLRLVASRSASRLRPLLSTELRGCALRCPPTHSMSKLSVMLDSGGNTETLVLLEAHRHWNVASRSAYFGFPLCSCSVGWWLRSPTLNNTQYLFTASAAGAAPSSSWQSASTREGVAFGPLSCRYTCGCALRILFAPAFRGRY